MIREDFLLFNENGLYCPYGQFYLDPQKPVLHAIVSHAHGDHAVKGSRSVYCTRQTAAFMVHRYKKAACKNFVTIHCKQPFELNTVKITFYPAGHILGSVMILLEFEGIRYLYTGDYKLQPDATCEPNEVPQADVLITETTFADPEISHPDPAQEIKKLNNIDGNILLGAYGLGKSQRLIRLITDHCPQKRVLVHHSIVPFNYIYQRFGIDIGKWGVYSRKEIKALPKHAIYLVPPFTFDHYFHAKDLLKIFASGWEKLQIQNYEKLFISDHVDWNDICKTVELVSPREVWTLHGDGAQLLQHYRLKLNVKALC